jgi:PAS domain S-box-containing protein
VSAKDEGLEQRLEEANKSLGQLNRCLESIVDNLRDGILIVDAEDRIRLANREAARLLDRSVGELVGSASPWPLRIGQTTRHELASRAAQPSLVEVSVSAVEWNGHAARLATLRDVTPHVELEQSWNRAQAELVEAAGWAIVAIDRDGRISRMNRMAERLAGSTLAEEKGKRLDRVLCLLDENDRRPIDLPLSHVGGPDTAPSTSAWLLARDGTERLVAVHGVALNDTNEPDRVAILGLRDRSAELHAWHVAEIHSELIRHAVDHSLDELLARALDDVGELVDSPIGFYHWVNADQRTLSLQQWSTRTREEFCTATGSATHYPIDEAGVWVDCVRQRRPVIHNDYASLPHKKGMPEGHAPVIRELVVPVFEGEKIVAILGVGNKPTDYTWQDAEIVSRFAQMTWAAVQQKRADEALRETETQLHVLSDHLPGGVVYQLLMNKDGGDRHFTYLSGGTEQMHGITVEEGLNDVMSIYGQVVAEDVPLLMAKEAEAAATMTPLTAEIRLRMANGELRWRQLRSAPRRTANGDLLWDGIELDITERKQVEEELKRSRDLLNATGRVAKVGGWELDLATNKLFWTEEVYRIHRLPMDREPDVRTAIEFYRPESRPVIERAVQQAIEHGEPFDVQLQILTTDGDPRWVQAVGQVEQRDGKVSRVFGTFQDITERKRAEGLLLAEKQFTEQALDAQHDTFFLFDPESGKALRWNRAFREISGYTDEEIAQLPAPATYFDPEDLERAKAATELVLRGEPATLEMDLICKDGSRIVTEYQAAPMDDERGERRYIVAIGRDVRARKQAELTLAENEHRHRTILQTAMSGYCVFDTNGRLLEVNETYCQMSGYDEDELLHMRIADLDVAEPADTILARMGALMARGEDRFESKHRRKDGSVFDIEVSVQYAGFGGGQFVAFLRDITERNQSAAALRESEEIFRFLMEYSPVYVFFKDHEARSLRLSRNYEAMLGRPLEELLGKTMMELFPSELAETMIADDIRVLSERRPVSVDEELNGRYYTTTKFPIIVDGEARYLAGYTTDVTDRTRAELALRERVKELTCLYALGKAMQEGLSVDDLCRRVVMQLKQAMRIEELAVPSIELEGTRFSAQRGDGPTHDLTADITVGDRVCGRLTVTYPIETAFLIPEEQELLNGIAELLSTWMQRKHANEALLRTNEQLAAATERAQEASRAKSEILTNVSHELRTPMNAVIGMLSLMLETELTDQQRRYAAVARSSAESLLRLLNDFLDLAKIEAGKLDIELLDFDLETVLDDLIASLALRAYDQGLELTCTTQSEVPRFLRGDPGRLRQILLNLLGNAVKFTPSGEVDVRVSVLSRAPDQVTLRFAVRDTGIGIPRDRLGSLFEKFAQVDSSTTRKFGGTGLGLAICAQLANLMGGQVGVESEEGRGSEFWLDLPLATPTRRPENRLSFDSPATDLQGVRVLVVDHSARARESICVRMRSWGMRPSEATDSSALLRLLRAASNEKEPYAIVLVEALLPGLDGGALKRALETDEHLRDVNVVMMVPLGAAGTAGTLSELGFSTQLTKPVRSTELKSVLASVLSARPGGAAPETLVSTSTHTPMLGTLAGRGARILVAEDNAVNQEVALSILDKLGAHAVAVADGFEAVEAFSSMSYDLILMDMRMPRVDGLEATRRIRSLEAGSETRRRIPIIAVTAQAVDLGREEFIAAGLDDYLPKPVTPQALLEMLLRWLPASKATNAGPDSSAADAQDAINVDEKLIFNRQTLMTCVMNDETLAQRVIDVFFEDARRRMSAFESMLSARDSEGVARELHTFKGAAAVVGAEQLSALISSLESKSPAENLEALRQHLPELERCLDELERATLPKPRPAP